MSSRSEGFGRWWRLALGFFVVTATVRGAEAPWRESPETIGRLKAVTARFQRMVDEKYLAGMTLYGV